MADHQQQIFNCLVEEMQEAVPMVDLEELYHHRHSNDRNSRFI
jgi:hypothetical protein